MVGEALTRICDGRAVKRMGRAVGAARPAGRLKPDTAKEAMAQKLLRAVYPGRLQPALPDPGGDVIFATGRGNILEEVTSLFWISCARVRPPAVTTLAKFSCQFLNAVPSAPAATAAGYCTWSLAFT